MADEWDKFVVGSPASGTKDEWEQYAQQTPQQNNVSDSLLGVGVGIPAVAGVGYGLAKSGLPQAVGRGIAKLSSGVQNIPKVTNINKGADFAQTIRQAFTQAHTEKVNQFASKLDELAIKNPTQQVSLQSVVDDIRNNWNEMTPEARRVVKNTPVLKDTVSDLWNKNAKVKPSEVSLKQSQEISNYINTKIPKNIRANNLDVMEILNNVRGSQLEAFPEMESVRGEYRKFIEPYNNVKQYFKFNKLLNGIKTKFGGAEGQAAVEKILPKEVIKKMGGYRAAAKISELPQDIPLLGRFFRSMGGMAIAPQALQAIEFQMQMDKLRQNNMLPKEKRKLFGFKGLNPTPEEINFDDLAI